MFILIILLSIFFLCHPSASPVERKECYYNLNDENLCESVLTSHVTLQECCCTLGAGWGDNCEVHPCPVNGTGEWSSFEEVKVVAVLQLGLSPVSQDSGFVGEE